MSTAGIRSPSPPRFFRRCGALALSSQCRSQALHALVAFDGHFGFDEVDGLLLGVYSQFVVDATAVRLDGVARDDQAFGDVRHASTMND